MTLSRARIPAQLRVLKHHFAIRTIAVLLCKARWRMLQEPTNRKSRGLLLLLLKVPSETEKKKGLLFFFCLIISVKCLSLEAYKLKQLTKQYEECTFLKDLSLFWDKAVLEQLEGGKNRRWMTEPKRFVEIFCIFSDFFFFFGTAVFLINYWDKWIIICLLTVLSIFP